MEYEYDHLYIGQLIQNQIDDVCRFSLDGTARVHIKGELEITIENETSLVNVDESNKYQQLFEKSKKNRRIYQVPIIKQQKEHCVEDPLDYHQRETASDTCPYSPIKYPGAPTEKGGPHLLYMGGLSKGATESVIRKYLEMFGPVKKVSIIREKKTRKDGGFGFLSFYDKETSEEVLKYSPHDIDGILFYVRKCKDEDSLEDVYVKEECDLSSPKLSQP